MQQYAAVIAGLVLSPSMAIQGIGELQGRENYLQGISGSRTTFSSWSLQQKRSDLGARSREPIPAHMLFLISVVKTAHIGLHLRSLKHLLLKLNSVKRLRNHHGLFSAMSSNSQQKTTKCWALSGKILRTRQMVVFCLCKTPWHSCLEYLMQSWAPHPKTDVADLEAEKGSKHNQGMKYHTRLRGFEQPGILNFMRRRCVGSLTRAYKMMNIVDWVTGFPSHHAVLGVLVETSGTSL